jgi:uncharacterized protein (DUF1810 family)
MDDQYDLQRFVEAQEPLYAGVLAELRAGRKRTHWIWFIFPQLKGLGHSDTAQYYGVSGLDEARAYLQHPILGPRLKECSGLVAEIEDRSVEALFGYPDDMKFRSSMTLFAQATQDEPVFAECLRKYFDGAADPLTLARVTQDR